MKLAIISPVYNEEECIELFYERTTAALSALDLDYEVLLVDDGSTDNSPALLEGIANKDPRWSAIFLARNFGHQAAICAGLDTAEADAVIIMDSDLQDAPEDISKLVEKWREGYQVVYAIRKDRKESIVMRFLYSAFYRLHRLLAEVDMPLDTGDFSLIDRKVLDTIKLLPEKRRFLRGLRSWVGFKQIGVDVERRARAAGTPKYTVRKLVRLASDGIFGFSWVPLRLLTISGATIVLCSVLYLLGILYLKYTQSFVLPGWTTVVLLVVVLGGFQLLGLGLIGEYIGRMFDEVKRRPTYIIARTVVKSQDS